MKKKELFEILAKQVKNNFASDENAQKAAESIIELIRAMLDDENEHTMEELKSKIDEAIKAAMPSDTQVEERIHNAIKLELGKFKAISNVAGNKTLSKTVQNEIAGAIMRAQGKEQVADAIKAVLKKNEVTGITYEEIMDYNVADIWKDVSPMLAAFHHTDMTKAFYTEDELRFAKTWTKNGGTKLDSNLVIKGKKINTEYLYAKQGVANEDIDDAQSTGNQAALLNVIERDNMMQLANAQLKAILVGGVSTFEGIASKSASDTFTTVLTAAAEGKATIEELRALCDAVENRDGKRKVLVLTQSLLTEISKYKYSTGGTVMFRSKEEIAGQLGVDEIWVTNILKQKTGLQAISLLPDGYWIKTKKSVNVSWPKYEENKLFFMREANCGGMIRDIKSTAVLIDNVSSSAEATE